MSTPFRHFALGLTWCIATTFPVPAAAQVIPATQEAMFWNGGQVVVLNSTSAEIRVEGPGKGETQSIPLDARFRNQPLGPAFDFHEGKYWATCRADITDQSSVIEIYSSVNGKNWVREGYAPREDPHGKVQEMYHLTGDSFLLLRLRGFREEKASSPMALGKRNDQGIIRYKELLPIGTSVPWLLEGDKDVWDFNQALIDVWLSFGEPMARSPRALVLASAFPGWFSVVDTSSDVPKVRLIKMFGEDVVPDYPMIERAILGMQPRPDGHFLIAARSKDAVLHARGVEKDLPPILSPQRDSAREAMRDRFAQIGAIQYPEVLWWDLDPEKGTLTKEEGLMGAPNQVTDPEQWGKFRFRLNSDGTIKAFY